MCITRLDIKGKKFNNLLVVEFSHVAKRGVHLASFWKCKCDCGNIVTWYGSAIVDGRKRSCGCGINRSNISKHPLYRIWASMKSRCTNIRHTKFKDYGGRGIMVYAKWINDFNQFCKDVGPRPGPKYSIDRIDNNGNYEPGNVRWATQKVQCNNSRRNIILNINGSSLTIAECAVKYGIGYGMLLYRIKHGWSIEKAITKLKTA